MIYTSSQKMADELNKIFPLKPEIYDAFCQIDRAMFVPSGFGHNAYKFDALPLATDSTISSPLTVAKMTTYLEVDKNVDSVLEIGCGSGYQAAILSKIVRRVFTIERIERLVIEAKQRFKALNLYNINLKYDDGTRGWKQFAPFDRILFSASIEVVPDLFFEQLKDGGVLVAPIRLGDNQVVTRFRKVNHQIITECIEDCKFVPVKEGKE